ncbi:MAG: hypothetical protein GX278_06910 [Aeromonadales bacterium]|nr:hypothetical protein [Aeromonadales bacterium]
MKTRNGIRQEINNLYKNKVISWLSNFIKTQAPFEPVRIYLGAPTTDEAVVANKDEFKRFCQDWHKEITAGKVDFIEKTYPDIGTIDVPIHLVFDKIDEIAAWAGHLVEYHSAENRLIALQKELPDLVDSGVEHIHFLTSLDDADFIRFLQVCKWLTLHRNSGAYIRQIPVRGIDTVWFEAHRYIILSFLRKYLELNPLRKDLLQLGLVPPPQTVRVLLLDNVLRSKVGGMRDLALTLKDLAKLDIKPRKVFFFDDLSTALSIPDIPGVVIIIMPRQISEICKISWVSHSQCSYISGIEMRSFALINNIRVYLPNTTAPALTKNVFLKNRDVVSYDDIELDELNPTMALTVEESMLYNLLALGTYGRKARIPQERIPLDVIYEFLDIQYDVNEKFKEDVKSADSALPPQAKTPLENSDVTTKTENTVMSNAENAEANQE